MTKISSVPEKARAQRNHYLYLEGHRGYRKKQHLSATYCYSIGKKLSTKYYRIGCPKPSRYVLGVPDKITNMINAI